MEVLHLIVIQQNTVGFYYLLFETFVLLDDGCVQLVLAIALAAVIIPAFARHATSNGSPKHQKY